MGVEYVERGAEQAVCGLDRRGHHRNKLRSCTRSHHRCRISGASEGYSEQLWITEFEKSAPPPSGPRGVRTIRGEFTSVKADDKERQCSITDGQSTNCSVSQATEQTCSVQNENSKCSVIKPPPDGGRCSVKRAKRENESLKCSVLQVRPHNSECSVFSNGAQSRSTCSVVKEQDDVSGGICSVVGGNGNCSVILKDASGEACSILLTGKDNRCSIVAGDARCSILVERGEDLTCSAEGGEGRNECSIINEPSSAQDICSVRRGRGSRFSCSVAGENTCSLIVNGDPFCSLFEFSGENSRCSVNHGPRGLCSVLRSGENQACSLFRDDGNNNVCSIITAPEEEDSDNKCSLFKLSEKQLCSIIDAKPPGKTPRRRICSMTLDTGRPGEESGPRNECSIFVLGAGAKNGQCSLIMTGNGFQGRAQDFCSVIGRQGTQGREGNACSVIVESQQAGTGFCSVIVPASDPKDVRSPGECSVKDYPANPPKRCSVIVKPGGAKGAAECSIREGTKIQSCDR